MSAMAANMVVSTLREVLGIITTEPDLTSSFIGLGGDSFKAVLASSLLKSRGINITRHQLLKADSIREIIGKFDDDNSSSAVLDAPDSIDGSGVETPQSSQSDSASLRDVALPDCSIPTSSPPSSGIIPKYGPHSPHVSNNVVTGSELSSDIEFRERPTTMDDGCVLTEIQLALIHGTLSCPGTNIISYTETYYQASIPRVKEAWHRVITTESIFHLRAFEAYRTPNRSLYEWHDIDPNNQSTLQHLDSQQGLEIVFLTRQAETPDRDRPTCSVTCLMHHAFTDARSFQILLDKVHRTINCLDIHPCPSFWDWSRSLQTIQNEQSAAGNRFWAERLAKHPSATGNLLLVNPDTKSTQRSASIHIELDNLWSKIAETCRTLNVTLAVFFHAAWSLIAATYADTEKVIFGTVLSAIDLPIPNSMAVTGPQINVLPFHVSIRKSETVSSFVRRIHNDLLELQEFVWTTPDNGFERKEYESALSVEFFDQGGEIYDTMPLESHVEEESEVPLSVMVEQHKSRIHLRYHQSRFRAMDMKTLGSCFVACLMQMARRPHGLIGSVLTSLLSPETESKLRVYGNCNSGLTTRTSIREDLVTLFEKAACENPNLVALDNGKEQLTYADLDRAASFIAAKLLEANVEQGDVVCVHSDRSVEWIVAIYGILKAGGVYCSLDARLPQTLRDQMFCTAGAKVFLTPTEAQLSMKPQGCVHGLSISTLREEMNLSSLSASEGSIPHRKASLPWLPAYVCFTSGSTGTPKGVLCTHEGLVAFQSDLEVRLFAGPGVRVAQTMSVAFDGSIHEIFSALSYGATLVLSGSSDALEPLERATSAILTPSIARVLDPSDYPNLKWVYLVGEPVTQIICDRWASSHSLYNMYGPTEATCGATIKQLFPDKPVTIGIPNPTTRVYILNSSGGLVQPGMVGEIYLAGVQVSKGYLNMPEATEERFLMDSIVRNMEMMYRTGDRGYWNDEGEVVCLGRNDRQIKLRGYRLDLNDLEIRVSKASQDIKDVAVVRLCNEDELGAMVQPETVSVMELRIALAEVLPHHAMPKVILTRDKFPTTSAGKIDYKKIIEICSNSANEIVPLPGMGAPPAHVHRVVCEAVLHVLGLPACTAISPTDHFRDLGGHSLQQIRLSRRLSDKLGVSIPLRTIIANPTVTELAAAVSAILGAQPDARIPSHIPKHGNLHQRGHEGEKPTPIESEWMTKYAISHRESACFNVSFVAGFDSMSTDVERLAHSWNTVLSRHKILRCRYVREKRQRGNYQRIYSLAPRVNSVISVNPWVEVNRPFQLDKEPPIRVTISRTTLVVVISHIVADYTTLSILLKESGNIYRDCVASVISQSYSDVSLWDDPVPECSRKFWTEYLGDYPNRTPRIIFKNERMSYQGRTNVLLISDSFSQSLIHYTEETKVTLQQLALASVALVLTDTLCSTDITLGVPFLNRKSVYDATTVGLFLEPLPVRIRLDSEGCPDGKSIALQAQESLQSALANAIPWNQLLQLLEVEPDYPDHPLFDIMVSVHEAHMNSGLNMNTGTVMEPRLVWSQGAKFKLMIELIVLPTGKMLLRLEYDDECISTNDIEQFPPAVLHCLDLIVSGTSYGDIKSRLADSTTEEKIRAVKMEDAFGMKFTDI